jgi:ParB family chromosome partitioning protein
VVCEKGLLENRLDKSDPQCTQVDDEIEKIIALAENIKELGLIHPITVWRANTTNYPVVTGHRRYYALRYLYGTNVKVRCKIHFERPSNLKAQRHAENFLRMNLPPAQALDSFIQARTEMAPDLEGLKATEAGQLVCKRLGMSNALRYRYEKLAQYEKEISALFKSKLFNSINAADEFVKECEKCFKSNSEEVSAYLQKILKSGKVVSPQPKKAKKSSAKKYFTLPKIRVEHSQAVKRLLTEDVTTLDIGVDWDNVDFEDPAHVEMLLERLIIHLTK